MTKLTALLRNFAVASNNSATKQMVYDIGCHKGWIHWHLVCYDIISATRHLRFGV